MKNSITLLCCMAVAVAGMTPARAQDKKLKLGHINTQELLSVMPEAKDAETKLAAHYKELENEVASMRAELQTKLDDYRKKEPMMTETIKKNKEEELTALDRRIQEFQVTAQQSYSEMQDKIQEPLLEKIRTAINQVAKENGYTYIFDVSAGIVLYFEAGDDILPLVKKKLGLM